MTPTPPAVPARRPFRPFTRLFFWLVLRKQQEQAVRSMSPFWHLVTHAQRRRRRANWKLLFGAAWHPASLARLEQEHLTYRARLDYQLMRLSIQTPAELLQAVRATGEENITSALKAGRGLLLVISHMGTWWHAALYLAARGRRVRAVVNPGIPTRFAEYIRTIGERFGATPSFLGQSAYQAAREAFAQNEIFVTAVDTSLRRERSHWLPCGPAEIAMDPGPAILALRQRVPVIQAITSHDELGRSCINYSPPLSLGPGTSLSTPDDLLAFWSHSLHEQWLRHPAQWWTLNFFSLRAPVRVPSPAQTHPA